MLRGESMAGGASACASPGDEGQFASLKRLSGERRMRRRGKPRLYGIVGYDVGYENVQ